MTDLEREQAIERLYQVLVGNEIPEVKRAAFAKMRELIEERSPEQVAKMEADRGLRTL